MAAGIPGSGIGGFFYLLSALLMPVQESVCLCCKKSNRASRQTVLRQVVNAVGVLGGVWSTGWFISKAFTIIAAYTPSFEHRSFTVFRYNNVAYGLLILLFVVLLVQFLSVVFRQTHPQRKYYPHTAGRI